MADVGISARTGGGVLTPEEEQYEARTHDNALFVGSRIAIGCYAMAFACLAFCYFYLRSVNSQGLWRPHNVTASVGTGTAIMLFALATAVLSYVALKRMRANAALDWEVASWVGVLGGLIAMALQCWELTELTFAPGSSGYASVFVGWAIFNIALLGSGVYFLETIAVRGSRKRRALNKAGVRWSAEDLFPSNVRVKFEGCYYFWAFIALASVFFWVFMYMVSG